MTPDDYQRLVSEKVENRINLDNLDYLLLGLIGETGELAEEVKRMIRDDGGILTDARREAIRIEAGDVLWYVAMIANRRGLSLSESTGWNYLGNSLGPCSADAGPGCIQCFAVTVTDAICGVHGGSLSDLMHRLRDVCDWARVTLESVAVANLAKINGRLARGTICGSGDR